MLIRRLKVSNFKSFDVMQVELRPFNVVIGANASGKSNLVDALRFLRDIAQSGLDNAISMQGGAEYLRNVRIGASENLSIDLDIESDTEEPALFLVSRDEDGEGFVAFMAREVSYGFSIEFYKKRRGHKRITREQMMAHCDVVRFREGKEKIGDATVALIRDLKGVTPSVETEPPGLPIEHLVPPVSLMAGRSLLSQKQLVLDNPLEFPAVSRLVTDSLQRIAIYDFDPQLPKRAVTVTGKSDLETDGSNLAIVLRDLLDDPKAKDKIYRLLRDALPFVQDIKVEKLADKSLLATVREVYSQKAFLPAFLMSDGTVSVTALIAALYFEDKPVVILEEPERNVHPHLISKVVGMMKDASENLGKQVIITTHNPEVVKHAGLENLLLLQRDEEGFSRISRPAETAQVRTFLENEIGIDDLFVDNLLEW